MESQCLRLKLLPGKTPQFLAWIDDLNGRELELKDVLRNAGIECEMLYLERLREGDFLILFTRAKDLKESNATFFSSQRPIDREARRIFQETCDLEVVQLEPLLEFI